MADTNGQKARGWKQFEGKIGSGNLSSGLSQVSDNQKVLLSSLAEIVKSYIQDIYGDDTEDKYKKIVDLIIKRVKNILNDNFDEFTNNEIDSLKQELQIELSNLNIKELEVKISDEDIQSISQKIMDVVRNDIHLKAEQTSQSIKIFLNNLLDEKKKYIDKQTKEIENKNEEVKEEFEENNEDKSIEKEENEEDDKESLVDYFNNLMTQLDSFISSSIIEFELIDQLEKARSILSYMSSDYMFRYIKKFYDVNDSIKKAFDRTIKIFEDVPNELKKTNKQKKEEKRQQKLIEKMNKLLKKSNKHLDLINQFFSSKHLISYLAIHSPIFLLRCMAKIVAFLVKLFIAISIPFIIMFIFASISIWPTLKEQLKPIFGKIGEAIESIKNMIIDYYNNVIKPVIDYFKDNIWPNLSKILKAVGQMIVDVLEAIKEPLEEVIKGVFDFMKNVFKSISDILKGIGSNMKKMLDKLGIFILNVVEILENLIKGIDTYFDQITKGIKSVVDAITGAVAQIIDGIRSHSKEFTQSIEKFKNTIFTIGYNFQKGYDSIGEQTTKAFKQVVLSINSCKELMKEFINTLIQTGTNIYGVITDIGEGLKTHISQIINKLNIFKNKCLKAKDDFIQPIKEVFIDMMKQLKETVTVLIDTVKDIIPKLIKMVWDKIKKAAKKLLSWCTFGLFGGEDDEDSSNEIPKMTINDVFDVMYKIIGGGFFSDPLIDKIRQNLTKEFNIIKQIYERIFSAERKFSELFNEFFQMNSGYPSISEIIKNIMMLSLIDNQTKENNTINLNELITVEIPYILEKLNLKPVSRTVVQQMRFLIFRLYQKTKMFIEKLMFITNNSFNDTVKSFKLKQIEVNIGLSDLTNVIDKKNLTYRINDMIFSITDILSECLKSVIIPLSETYDKADKKLIEFYDLIVNQSYEILYNIRNIVKESFDVNGRFNKPVIEFLDQKMSILDKRIDQLISKLTEKTEVETQTNNFEFDTIEIQGEPFRLRSLNDSQSTVDKAVTIQDVSDAKTFISRNLRKFILTSSPIYEYGNYIRKFIKEKVDEIIPKINGVKFMTMDFSQKNANVAAMEND